jgi:long-chain acyl-CoA synthetase
MNRKLKQQRSEAQVPDRPPERELVHDLLDTSAFKEPDLVAMEFWGQTVTYGQIRSLTDNLARGLSRLGIGRGERVLLALPNVPQFIIAYFGILKAGARVVPVSTLCRSAEFEHILGDCRPKAAITSSIVAPELGRAVRSSGCAPLVVCIDSAGGGEAGWHSLLSTRSGRFVPADAGPDDVAAILYTSGTTGRPKGVQLTHSNLFTNAKACARVAGVSAGDKYLCVLPLFHAFGQTCIMNAGVAAGASLILRPQFNPREIAGAIAAGETTSFAAVPSMLAILLRCLQAAEVKRLPLRLIVSGGAPLPAEILRQYRHQFGLRICEGYGLTESSPVISMNRSDGSYRAGSVGQPLPGVRVRIVDDCGRDVPAGREGEILVKGPNVMKGYLNLPEETASVVRDGWLFTGDLGCLDKDGYLFVVGRKKDLIIRNGVNIYPAEIEQELCRIEGIAEATVIGVPDRRHGEVAVAFVAISAPLTEKDILSHCRGRLASHKVPGRVVLLDNLPRTSSGKVSRQRLREIHRELF